MKFALTLVLGGFSLSFLEYVLQFNLFNSAVTVVKSVVGLFKKAPAAPVVK